MPLLLSLLLSLLLLATGAPALHFDDVSEAAGMLRPYGPRIKYGGVAVADLNADGFQDFLVGHHDDRFADLYLNNRDGSFRRSTWGKWRDTHSFNPVRLSPYVRRMHFTLSQGGSNGGFLKSPEMFEMRRNDAVGEVTVESGISSAMVRGRSAIYMQLDHSAHRFPDVIFTSANIRDPATGIKRGRQAVFQGVPRRRFEPRNLTGFENIRNTYGAVMDVDGDGQVELLTFQKLRIHRVVGPFAMEDITDTVLPQGAIERVSGVAELDFDNDGLWDLYLSRTSTTQLAWQRGRNVDDVLLRNVGGRFVDVSEAAGIPKGTQSRGVTTGDFDNDGFVDILVTQYEAADLLLMNNGDGTFRTMDAAFNRSDSVHGDHATAVDYDRDGRLDVLLSEGDWGDKAFAGFVRVMRNAPPSVPDVPLATDAPDGDVPVEDMEVVDDVGKALLVRVRSAPKRRATSLHAVCVVKAGAKSMMRRVGSPGTVTGNSYIELLHFGVGNMTRVDNITVRWTDGSSESKQNVAIRPGMVVTFGRF